MSPAKFPDGLERRAGLELRLAGRRLEGYVASWNVPARIGGFTETIRAGAFRASLDSPGADCLCLVDHDPGRLLGRQRAGTLRLCEDTRGLHFDVDVPDTSLGRDVLALAERGDLGGMSFGFRPVDEAWPAPDRRELRSVALVEVSVIHAHAAYGDATEVSARARAGCVHARAEARRRRQFLETL